MTTLQPPVSTAAAVLMGGGSTRMGRPKQHVALDGVTMGAAAIKLAQQSCGLVVISGPSDAMPGLDHIADRSEHAGHGPLAGIEAVLASGQAARWLILPCDMPALTIGSLERLLASTADLAAFQDPAQPSEPLPLPLVIRASMYESVFAYLNTSRRSIRGWMESVGVACVGAIDASETRNINHL